MDVAALATYQCPACRQQIPSTATPDTIWSVCARCATVLLIEHDRRRMPTRAEWTELIRRDPSGSVALLQAAHAIREYHRRHAAAHN